MAVIGAGIGGLVAALELAAAGLEVTVFERAATPGGKLREIAIDGVGIDAGPTVFTMRWVFEEIFARAGADFAAHVALRPLAILARHAWSETERLDLFADDERTADAIGAFAGAAEARGYLAFRNRARGTYAALERPFICAARPTMTSLIAAAGMRGLADLLSVSPFSSLWRALGEYFRDPRLLQLFARYATYCGSSPFLAPATLMLVAHVEQEGVWTLPGGMHALATAVAKLAALRGVRFRYGAHVEEIVIRDRHVTGVRLAGDEQVMADAVVANADAAAVANGLLGAAVAGAVPSAATTPRSLSALTWAIRARIENFPLLRHTVFFGADYAAEFDDIFRRARLPRTPTVYVCAQDRDGSESPASGAAERVFMIVNAPAIGDQRGFTAAEIAECEQQTFGLLSQCGMQIDRRPESTVITTPQDSDGCFRGRGVRCTGWPCTIRWPRSAATARAPASRGCI